MNNIKLTRKIAGLLEIIKKFIDYKIKLIDFIEKYEKLYEELFLENEKSTIKYIGEKIACFFDDIHADVNFFVADEKVRKEDPSYLNEKQLRENVKKLYEKIKIRMKKGKNESKR